MNYYYNKNILEAGLDEAGRGPLAGPVVAAAVIFPKNIHLPEVNDSKKLSEKKREKQFNFFKHKMRDIIIPNHKSARLQLDIP